MLSSEFSKWLEQLDLHNTLSKVLLLDFTEAATRGLGLQLYEKEALAPMFSCEFCEISKNTFFTEHLRATASVKN